MPNTSLMGLIKNRSGRSERLLNSAIGLLAICSVVITGLVVRRELSRPVDNGPPSPRTVANWREYTTAGHLIGSGAASVTIVEFSDFQCPSCKEMHVVLARLRAGGLSGFKVLYRHYPLRQIHPFAYDAAVASECAAAQGRFEAFHNLLFDKQDSIGILAWEGLAGRAGVSDRTKFRTCLQGRAASEAVQRDIVAGDSLGVRGTPTVLVEDLQVTGVVPEPVLEEWIRARLQGGEITGN